MSRKGGKAGAECDFPQKNDGHASSIGRPYRWPAAHFVGFGRRGLVPTALTLQVGPGRMVMYGGGIPSSMAMHEAFAAWAWANGRATRLIRNWGVHGGSASTTVGRSGGPTRMPRPPRHRPRKSRLRSNLAACRISSWVPPPILCSNF